MSGGPGSAGTGGGKPDESAGGGEPGGEAGTEGSGFSADARWVVLLGVASSVVAVLAYLGVSWPMVVHALTGSTASASASSSAPPPAPAQVNSSPPALVFTPASSFPPAASPTLTPTSPASTAVSSSPPITAGDYDNVATDPTDVDVDSMFPQSYSVGGNITFNRTSWGMRSCPVSAWSTGVATTLKDYGCTSELDASFLDNTQQIQISVWVIPLPDATDATGAYNALWDSGVDDWNIWCPTTGPGSSVCQGAWRNATQEVWTGHCHRYVIRALALLVNLGANSSYESGLTAAAKAAVYAVGPQRIPTAACWPAI